MRIRASLRWPAKLFFLPILLFNPALFAQYNGNIQGVVFDPNNAVVNGASVQLRNVDTGVIAATTTSDAGNYRFSSLQPGHYIVSADASGFSKAEVSVTLGTSETQGINIRLAVGSSSTAVTVTAEAPTRWPDRHARP